MVDWWSKNSKYRTDITIIHISQSRLRHGNDGTSRRHMQCLNWTPTQYLVGSFRR